MGRFTKSESDYCTQGSDLVPPWLLVPLGVCLFDPWVAPQPLRRRVRRVHVWERQQSCLMTLDVLVLP